MIILFKVIRVCILSFTCTEKMKEMNAHQTPKTHSNLTNTLSPSPYEPHKYFYQNLRLLFFAHKKQPHTALMLAKFKEQEKNETPKEISPYSLEKIITYFKNIKNVACVENDGLW